MNMMYIPEALSILRPNSKWIVEDSTITWLDEEQTQPTQSELEAKVAELEAQAPLVLLRKKRNKLLAETDWWASSDLTMTAEQTAYRQALRDITNTYSSLDDVVWPEKP